MERVKEARKSGMTYDQIVQFCIDQNICSRQGTPLSRATIIRWCKGIKLIKKRKTTARVYKDKTPGLTAFILPLHKEGRSVRQITTQANLEGFTTSKGNPLRPTQIQRVIERLAIH